MKLMKKFMKKSEGFTLVELIVVIAILAILAGVAVPVYSSYIKKANDAAIITELDAIATAAQAANATKGGITSIKVTTTAASGSTAASTKIVVKAASFADDFAADFKAYYPNVNRSTGTPQDKPTSYEFVLTNSIDFAATASYVSGAEWLGSGWDDVHTCTYGAAENGVHTCTVAGCGATKACVDADNPLDGKCDVGGEAYTAAP